MATRIEAANKLADLILELVIKNDAIDNTTIQNYRRIVDSQTGTPTVTPGISNQENIILYGNDYRQSGFAPAFYDKIDMVVDTCLAKIDGSYELPDINQLGFNPACILEESEDGCSGTYGTDAWIEFSPPATNDGNTSYGTMCTGYATNLTLTGLQLSLDVLSFLSQFVPFDNTRTIIDPTLAEEVLDTNIYELIPRQKTRQERIDAVFSEFNALLGPSPVDDLSAGFDVDVNHDGLTDTWTDLNNSQDTWDNLYGINPNTDPDSGNIVRLERHTEKGGQSLESMRNILDNYLKDLDYVEGGQFTDERLERETEGKGYLQIRHLNQAIIIRNEEDKDLGIVGPDYNNPLWLERGFTISIWVRFLTQTAEGTLFNFGNPTRANNPYGFKLETFTVSKDDYTVNGNYDSTMLPPNAFQNSDYARFVRVVVHEPDSQWCTNYNNNEGCIPGTKERDSHFGTLLLPHVPTLRDGLAYEFDKHYAFNYTEIPVDFNEWFYIVATYNPIIQEDTSNNICYPNDSSCSECNSQEYQYDCNLDYNKWHWLNHVQLPIQHTDSKINYIGNSSFGAKCKVEVISKSEMNRALGYKN